MTDIVDRSTRSRMMSGIRSRDTAPELAVRRFLHSEGFRFRLGGSGLPGRPDVVLRKWKAVVFVHGCFWHRHAGCRYAYSPSSNRSFWKHKFLENVARDRRAVSALRSQGWNVEIIWECELSPQRLRRLTRSVRRGSSTSTSRRPPRLKT